MNIKEIWDNIEFILTLIIGIFLLICLIGGTIGAIIHAKRYGSLPIGQGYGRK